MTELIERLAREAGLRPTVVAEFPESLEALAKAVAGECAEIASQSQAGDSRKEPRSNTSIRCAQAIRERFGL